MIKNKWIEIEIKESYLNLNIETKWLKVELFYSPIGDKDLKIRENLTKNNFDIEITLYEFTMEGCIELPINKLPEFQLDWFWFHLAGFDADKIGVYLFWWTFSFAPPAHIMYLYEEHYKWIKQAYKR